MITSSRLEAFSDGVLAIIITIMVLEMHTPDGYNLKDLITVLPNFMAYVLSFAYVGIYWNNHHHLLKSIEKVNSKVLWSNLFFLFSISLIPFSTSWMANFYDKNIPVALYSVVLAVTAISYLILQTNVIHCSKYRDELEEIYGKDIKGKLSLFLYSLSIVVAFFAPIVSQAIYVFVAIMWFVPDKRIEKLIERIEEN